MIDVLIDFSMLPISSADWVENKAFLCVCVNKHTHVHMCVEDRGAEIEWSCLMTGTADSFRESSER